MAEKKPSTDSSTPKRRHPGQFKPGQSGNPKGKPKGARNRITRAMEELLDQDGEAITKRAAELAKLGHPVALRLCLERLLPPVRERPMQFALPKLEKPQDAPKAIAAIVEAVAVGDLTPSEAATLTGLVEVFRKAFDTADLMDRLAQLETAINERNT